MNVAIILAGGSGIRMGAGMPKQFIPIQGKPIILHTLEKFQNHSQIDLIEIVCIESHLEYIRELVETCGLDKVRLYAKGGPSFMRSAQNGIYALEHICRSEDIVLFHMAVAPFMEADIITDSLRVCREKGNSISANPCLLCMGEYTTDEYSDKSILRETLVGLNTPQSFRYEDILSAFRWADEQEILDQLEPHITSLMYERGCRLYFSKGSQYNFKITTQDDLALFEGYLMAKQLKMNKTSQEERNDDQL